MGRRKKEQNVIPVKNLFSLLDVDNDLQDLPDAAKLEKGTKGNKKDRLIRLWRFLYEYTDEKHRITTQEIIKLFEKKYGMEVNRKTVKDDGETLHDAGYSVEINKSANNQYYMTKREFTIPELKLLIDAVAATQFISKQTTMDLTDKLFRLMSVHQAQEMGSYVHVDYGVKADDDSIPELHTKVCEKLGIQNEVSSFHAGAETHIYCHKKNIKGETFIPSLLGLADIFNMHSTSEKVDYTTLLKGYDIIKELFAEFNA